MSHPFRHPKGKELLNRVAHSIRGGATFVLPGSPIIFVCGGSADGPSMRQRFLDYAAAQLTHLRFFLAETAQMDYVNHIDGEFQNVAEFEDVMAEISTCTILFPESPGSFAELGYFSKNEKLRKKLLIVNDLTLQGQDSFIALGPVGLVDIHSTFRPTIQMQFDDVPDFALIRDRLNNRIPAKKRKRFSNKNYKKLSNIEKFYTVFEIIRIFRALTYDGISFAFRRIWHHVKASELHRILSILIAANYVLRGGEEKEYFCLNVSTNPFFEYTDLNVDRISIEALDLYQREYPEVVKAILGLGK